MTGLHFNPAGIEPHVPLPEVGEIVFHLEIVHAGVPRDNFLQQFAQLRNVPLPVAQFINQTPFCFFRATYRKPGRRQDSRP
jgi:hypothetical protein